MAGRAEEAPEPIIRTQNSAVMYLQSLAIADHAVVGDRMYVSMQAARV